MSFPGSPILEFPIGSESISTKIIEIKWKSPKGSVAQNDPVSFYQIFYRDSESLMPGGESWEIIATISSASLRYNWIIPEYLFGSNVQIAVRSVGRSGNYSEYAISARFKINEKPIPKPSISNPIAGKKYGSQIDIDVNNPNIQQDASKINRFRINIYYSSISNGISYAPIVERASGSVSKIIWNTEQLSPANDYVIYAFYSDDFGRKGSQSSVGPFTVENQGYMLIDTDGPEVAVKIGSNNGFVSDRDIGVEIYAYDEIDGIHGFKLIENIRNQNGSIENIKSNEPRFYQKNNFLTLSDEDNQYVITALVQDLAGNRATKEDASAIKIPNNYRKFFNRNGYKITAWLKNEEAVYVAIFDGTYTQIIKIEMGKVFFLSSFLGRILSMGISGSRIFGSKFNNNRFLEIVSIESTGIVPLVSLLTPDTEASSIHDSRDGGLLLGCINGNLYKYMNGTPILLQNLESPISKMYNGQINSVFILTETSEKVYIYNNGNLNQVKITI